MATPDTLSPMATLADGSLSLSAPDAYAGVSVRSLPGYIHGLPGEALPCDRIGDKIVVKRSRHASSPVPAASAVIDRGQTSGRA